MPSFGSAAVGQFHEPRPQAEKVQYREDEGQNNIRDRFFRPRNPEGASKLPRDFLGFRMSPDDPENPQIMEPRPKEDYPFPLERRQIKGDVDLSYGFQAVPDDPRVVYPELFHSHGIEISFGLVRCFLEIAD